MPQGMPGGMPGNMQGNRPGGPMNQPGGMGMPGNQSRGGGMSQQRAQRDNDGWRGPGHHGHGYGHQNTSITNINIIGTDTLGIYIALGNVGVRICATKDWQASYILSGATHRTTVVPLTRCGWYIKTMIEHDARFSNCEPLPARREVAVSNRKAALPRGSGIRAISCVASAQDYRAHRERPRRVTAPQACEEGERKCSVNNKPGQNFSFVYRRPQ